MATGEQVAKQLAYKSVKDRGHVALCLCGEPHDFRCDLIGKERTLEIRRCPSCEVVSKKFDYTSNECHGRRKRKLEVAE